jgi:hypothetical protein
MSGPSLQTTLSSTSASLVNAAAQNLAVAAPLLKKAMDSDKNLIDTLLPTNGSNGGQLDIRA